MSVLTPSARRMRKQSLTLAQYVKESASAGPSRGRPPAPFVTISRQAGAGAHALAEALIARFSQEKDVLFAGWQVFDRNICERVAADPDLHVSLQSLLDEDFHTGLDDYLRGALADMSSQIAVDHHMFRIVRGICAMGKAVVIGRAAALITRDLPLGVHLRLVSPPGARVKRISREYNIAEMAARDGLNRKDARRARMVDAYFEKDIADPLLYDCVWNTGAVPFDVIAESMICLIRRRAARASDVAGEASPGAHPAEQEPRLPSPPLAPGDWISGRRAAAR
jgi:cytidylate kinase